ncbi:MAG: class I SAM-dependent methyltransferase [Streptosporangiales bacterium]|nr:class I SAM-dependent methyltransferase [Streptosporangiales bacterium]
MEIEVRPVRRLRETPGARDAFGPLVDAVAASGADLARLRVVCDWIQYRHNFRETAVTRPVLPAADGGPEEARELAVDLRRWARADPAAVAADVAAALAGGDDGDGRVWLEDWVHGSASRVWRFNSLYWQHLADWEKATGKEYERALPGGESDGRNAEAARDLIWDLFKVWDELEARRALPPELYVLELGVGNGGQARAFLDTFTELDRRHGRDYYRRLHYLMGDYSAHVLDRAREEVAHHGSRVSGLVLEATRLPDSLAFLAGKAFCVYISNVYDNLPADEVAVIRGRAYLAQVRSYLPAADAAAIAARFGIGAAEVAPLAERLLRIGPELLSESAPDKFGDTGAAVRFWQDAWSALRQAERYVPLEGLDGYRLAPGVTGEVLRPLLGATGDVRMHVSNGALASFAGTLPLLHPFGRLVCHDLFTTDLEQYRTGFYGPGKYDGSTVNWVNGPLLALLASRRGFDVAFTPFKQRPGSHVKTLTAQVRDLCCCPRRSSGRIRSPNGSSASKPSTTSAGSAPPT